MVWVSSEDKEVNSAGTAAGLVLPHPTGGQMGSDGEGGCGCSEMSLQSDSADGGMDDG